MSDFGPHLRTVMEDRGILVRDLAGMLDVPESTISRWRSSKSGPNVATMVRIADALGIAPTELLPPRAAPEAVPKSPKAHRPRTAATKLRLLEGGRDERNG